MIDDRMREALTLPERSTLEKAFQEALSWGLVYGGYMAPGQWESMSKKQAHIFAVLLEAQARPLDAPTDAPTDAERLREALTLARPYVEEATRRTFDGMIGPSMRNRAERHLAAIDAAMRATPADGGEG